MHELLALQIAAAPGTTVLDLGCGGGRTLAAVRQRSPGARLIGFDQSESGLDAAALLLGGTDTELRLADLEQPLDLPDDSVDAVVCHNVLECLADPVVLMNEAARVLRPGGLAVWSHVDFDALIISGAETATTRAVVHAYADHTQAWMRHSDGRLGRKLPALAARSRLDVIDITIHSPVWTRLDGEALARIDEITAVVLDASSGNDAATPSADQVLRWRGQLDEADRSSSFFLAEPTVLVTARSRN